MCHMTLYGVHRNALNELFSTVSDICLAHHKNTVPQHAPLEGTCVNILTYTAMNSYGMYYQ